MYLNSVCVAGAIVGLSACAAHAHNAKKPRPLALEEQGSFFVGGKIIQTDAANTENIYPREGTVAAEQMYVRYLKPVRSEKKTPIVLIHGGGVSSTCYESTPDGRMGWDEYFARKGRATYVVDQVGRAKSNFDLTQFNRVRLGVAPPDSLPALRILTREQHWTVFRFGSTFGTPFKGQQFPIKYVDELAKQGAPTQNSNNLPHLSELSKKLNGAVLVSHSQSGGYPQNTVLQVGADGIRGIVNMEPGGGCGNTTLTDEQIKKLAKIPYMTLFGDFIQESTSTVPHWPTVYSDCQAMVKRLKAAGGDATFIDLPKLRIKGNSHMLMQDKNNLKVADIIDSWIETHVRRPRK